MKDVVIVSAARKHPLEAYGALSTITAPELGCCCN